MRDGILASDVKLENFIGNLTFRRHGSISNDGDRGYEEGVKVGAGVTFCTCSGNCFTFVNGTMGLGIRPEKVGFESGVRLGNLLKTTEIELNGGIQGTDVIGVLPNAEMEYDLDDDEHGRTGVFEELEEVKSLIKILVRIWLLLIDIFWLVLEPGAKSNVLFDDTLGFNSDSDLLKLDVGNVSGVGGKFEVVFNLDWRSGNNDDFGSNEEVALDNKFLITNFINSGL